MPYHQDHPLQGEVLRITADILKNKIYTKIRDFGIEGYVTEEPVPFSEREKGEYRSFRVGECWGKVWDCGWFRLKGNLTASEKGKTVVAKLDFSGEAQIFDKEGCPVKGLTSVKSNMTYTLGNMGKTVYPLTQCANGNETYELIVEAGNNDLFGGYKGGEIVECGLYECNTAMRELYYDFAVLYELMMVNPKERAFHHRIRNALSKAESLLKTFSDEEIAQCRALLAPLLQVKSAETGFDLSALGHAHLDLAWTWPIRETIRKGARTFSSAVYAMQKYPFYKFGASQMQLYDWMKQRYPLLFDKVKNLVKEGRWEVQGGMWVESDLNATGGESLVRQFLYGQKFCKENFGKKANVCWLPDTFGFTGSLPQLMKSAGMNRFVTQKIRTSPHRIEYPHDTFYWEGIDGSKVLTHVAPFENYGSSASPQEVYRTEVRFHDKYTCPSALLLFGQGDGGGGAGYECLECLSREADAEGIAKTRSRTAEEFFEVIEKNADEYQTWFGPMDLDMHTGTLTSACENKKKNKQTEICLHTLEWLSTLADTGISKQELDEIWHSMLLYQFHDILPGSSIKRVYDECLPHYDQMLERLQEGIAAATEQLAKKVSCKANEIFAVNPSPFAQKFTFERDGKVYGAEVPAYFAGAAQYSEIAPALSLDGLTMENECLKVRFSEDGSILSVIEKSTGREAVNSANKLCVYQDFLHYNEQWGMENAWDFPIRYKDKAPDILKAERIFGERGADFVSITAEYRYHSSRIRQRAVLKTGSSKIDFETYVDWHESEKMLRSITDPAVFAAQATRGIQFGHVSRPVNKNTMWEYALFENVGQRYVDKSEKNFGVSLLSPMKYGYRLQDGQLDINLLRSTSYPAEHLDEGEHTFVYSLYVHTGDFYAGSVIKEAYNNEYPVTLSQTKGSGKGIKQQFCVQGDVIVETVKPAERGKGIVLRMYEPNGASVTASLSAQGKVFETDILEESERAIPEGSEGCKIAFRPFEIKTIVIR